MALLHDAEAEEENQVKPSLRIAGLVSGLLWLLLGAVPPAQPQELERAATVLARAIIGQAPV